MILGINLGGRNDLKCEHLVKFDGKKIEISGISLDNFKLGSLGIEPTLIQAAGQSLMMLDASQYSLCQKVKGAPDEEAKKKYYSMMMDDQLRAQGIYRAIATLSMDPTSQVLQDTVKKLLLSSLTTTSQRAVEIEKSELGSTVEHSSNLPSENSLEIGNSSLDQKVSELNQSYPELKKQIPTPQLQSNVVPNPLKEQCIGDIDNLTKLLDEATYEVKLIDYITSEFLPYIRSIYRGSRCEGMEDLAKNSVRNLSINLESLVEDFRKLSGLDTRQKVELRTMMKLRIEEILQTCRSGIVSMKFSNVSLARPDNVGQYTSEQQKVVFISYSDSDIQRAEKLFEIFQVVGLEPWMKSRSLLAGRDKDIEIRKAIKNSKFFIALFSSISVRERGYIQKELKFALDVLDEFPEGEVFILPIRLDDCEIPYGKLRDIQNTDLFPNWKVGVEKVLRSLGIEEERIKECEILTTQASLSQVFISYAKEDINAAQRLYAELKTAGLAPWMDKYSILPGQNWDIEIKKAIKSSRYFIPLTSSNSVGKRGVVQTELKRALDAQEEFPESAVFIILVRLDDSQLGYEKLEQIHYADMFPNWEEGFQQILQTIKNEQEKNVKSVTVEQLKDQLVSSVVNLESGLTSSKLAVSKAEKEYYHSQALEDKLSAKVEVTLSHFEETTRISTITIKDKIKKVRKRLFDLSNVLVLDDNGKPFGILYKADLYSQKDIAANDITNFNETIFEDFISSKELIDHITKRKWEKDIPVNNFATIAPESSLLQARERMYAVSAKDGDVLCVVEKYGIPLGIIGFDIISYYLPTDNLSAKVEVALSRFEETHRISMVTMKDEIWYVTKKLEEFPNVLVSDNNEKPFGILYKADLYSQKDIAANDITNFNETIFEDFISSKELIDHITKRKWEKDIPVNNFATIAPESSLLQARERMYAVSAKDGDVLCVVEKYGIPLGIIGFDIMGISHY